MSKATPTGQPAAGPSSSSADDSRDRLSRAMGAAFLAHQVSELERSVDSINFSRDPRLYDINGRGRGGKGGRGGGRSGKRELRVVDASALVHALPLLKRWVREDAYHLVVPLEAISILDILKRAPNPLHDLARDATRFLETQLNIARQITSDGTFVPKPGEQDPRIRLRAQAKGEELTWDEVTALFAVPDGYVHPTPPPIDGVSPEPEVDENGGPVVPPPPTANDIPRTLRSTLQCALYFHSKLPSSNPKLLLHSPTCVGESPPPPPPPQTFRSNGTPLPPPTDFNALSSGETLNELLSTFFPSVEVHPILTSEIVAAREWMKAQAAAMAAAKEMLSTAIIYSHKNEQVHASWLVVSYVPFAGPGGTPAGGGLISARVVAEQVVATEMEVKRSTSATPIASLYSSTARPPTAQARPRIDSAYSTTSGYSSTENERPPSRVTFSRNSVYIEPDDDLSAWHGGSELAPAPLGGEEWRISEEGGRPSGEAENGGREEVPQVTRKTSFLKNMARRTRSNQSFSSSTGRVSVSSISSPISQAPPRIGPLRTSGSLVSLQAVSNRNSLVLSPTTSSNRLSFAQSTNSVVSFAQSTNSVAGSEQLLDDPPTQSSKAREVLGGGSRIYAKNGVERHRTSIYTEEDRAAGLGLAITTDLPTRHVVPDNARLSIFSSTTASSSRSASGQSVENRYPRPFSPYRDPRNPPYASSHIPSVAEMGAEEQYDPAQEDGDPASIYRVRMSESGARPRFPPGNVPPIPPRPETPSASVSPTVVIHEASPHKDSAETLKPSLNSGFSSIPPPPLPPKHPGRYLSKKSSKAKSKASSNSLPRPKSSSSPKPTATVAALWMVAGLPKEPHTWSLSDLDASDGAPVPAHAVNAVPRYWRPEVLSCATTGDPIDGAGSSLDGTRVRGKARADGRRMMEGEYELLSKETVQRIQSKAMKLAFNRDVEILSSTVQPPATCSTFSFTVPVSKVSAALGQAGSTAAAWDSWLSPTQGSAPVDTTFFAASLLTWSHADPARSDAIQLTLDGGGKARSTAIHRSLKAASKGKSLGAKLARQMVSPLGAVPLDGRNGFGEETDTDGFTTESEWGDSKATARPLAPSSGSLPFWLPYSLIIVSSAPIYSLLMDILRISWARCHQDVATFALSMHNLLHFKLPLVGEKIQLPVSADLAHNNTRFVATIPGGFDFSLGASRDHDIPFWPLFRALDADNLLKAAEVALSPLGRVLLISAHPVMLGIAAEAFRVILERQGWKGAVHPTVHARDLKLFVEDPGPWLIAIPSESRAIALTDISPEVAIVDLDQNSVIVRNTSPGALLSGSAREKARTRLANAINVSSSYFCVPPELQEAFPVGRFRPFSAVEVAGVPKEAERLRPPVNWDWDQDRALKEFDAILCEAPRTSLLSKVLRLKATRRAPVLSAETTHVQTIIRDHLKTFVDRRDLLESRINGLNTKLALLMSESLEWEKSLEIFKAFSEKLTRESMDLKTRLEKERRESRRLTTAVGRERQVQAQLEASLSATNSAREEALLQLANVEAVRSTLARQKNALETEIRTILSAGETGPLYEAVYSRIEALSARSDTSSRPGTSLSTRSLGGGFSRRRSSVIGGIDEMEEEEEDVYDERVTEMAYDGSRETVQMVVQEAISSIQSRLAIVLQSAEQMEGPGSRRSSTSSSILLAQTQERLDNTWSHVNADGSPIVAIPSQDFPDTPPQSSTFPTQVDEEVEELSEVPVTIKTHEPRRFRPKPFQLASPPTTPDVDSIPGAFVTTRSTRPRRRHRAQPSTSSDTFSFDDGNPPRGAISFDKSFFTPNGSYEYSVDPSFSRQSDTDADSFVSAEGYSSPNDSYHAQEKPSPSDDDDATEVNPSPVQPRSTSVASIRSWHEQRAESPFGSTSVEFFTRASSRAGSRAGSRNGRPMLFAEQPSKLPRPVSGISVSSTVKEIRKRFE